MINYASTKPAIRRQQPVINEFFSRESWRRGAQTITIRVSSSASAPRCQNLPQRVPVHWLMQPVLLVDNWAATTACPQYAKQRGWARKKKGRKRNASGTLSSQVYEAIDSEHSIGDRERYNPVNRTEVGRLARTRGSLMRALLRYCFMGKHTSFSEAFACSSSISYNEVWHRREQWRYARGQVMLAVVFSFISFFRLGMHNTWVPRWLA